MKISFGNVPVSEFTLRVLGEVVKGGSYAEREGPNISHSFGKVPRFGIGPVRLLSPSELQEHRQRPYSPEITNVKNDGQRFEVAKGTKRWQRPSEGAALD